MRLNTALSRIDKAVAGFTTVALTDDYSLSSSNTADDEARSAMLKFTGAGPWTVTIPAVSKTYKIWNACTSAVTITTGSGSTVVLDSGDIAEVFCDGTNVKTLGYGGLSLKAYVAAAISSTSSALPAQTANADKFLTTNGVSASWAYPTTASLSDWTSKRTEIIGIAAALAIVL